MGSTCFRHRTEESVFVNERLRVIAQILLARFFIVCRYLSALCHYVYFLMTDFFRLDVFERKNPAIQMTPSASLPEKMTATNRPLHHDVKHYAN